MAEYLDSDDEYFDSLSHFEGYGSDSTRVKKLETGSGNSSVVEPHVQTENFSNQAKLEEKTCSLLEFDSSAQDVHHNSGESNSSESSLDHTYVCKVQEEIKGSSEYVVYKMVDKIFDGDIDKMMQKFKKEDYLAAYSDVDLMVTKCRLLYERDYHCEMVDNSGGVLCNHYPVRLIVPVAKKSRDKSIERSESVNFDPKAYADKAKKAAACRLRRRFVAPVIMFDKKFICRAGTITVRKTAAYETALQSSYPQAENMNYNPVERFARSAVQSIMGAFSRGYQAVTQFFTPDSVEQLRDIDAQILRDLNVKYICDLMIENRKRFKRVALSSSEKINIDIYRDCNIEQMPYPGCGFFKMYHKTNRNPEGLLFNWERPDADAMLELSEDPSDYFPNIVWDSYKEWDLVELTKNYMKVLLLYLAKDRGGLLVHCVSGWDRTPLFISILRVSLWADGIIHQSLDYKDMAYLTLTYDWYLFGHNLPTRLKKKEEIMHFCFKFLPYIVDDEFSLTRIFRQLPVEQREKGSLPNFKPGVRTVINKLCDYVFKVYDEHISGML